MLVRVRVRVILGYDVIMNMVTALQYCYFFNLANINSRAWKHGLGPLFLEEAKKTTREFLGLVIWYASTYVDYIIRTLTMTFEGFMTIIFFVTITLNINPPVRTDELCTVLFRVMVTSCGQNLTIPGLK